MPESERRRRRPAVSCILCRKRKIKCNRESPCNNCVKSRSGTCVYESNPLQIRRLDEGRPSLQPKPAFKAPSPTLGDAASQTSVESRPYTFPTISVHSSSSGLLTAGSQSPLSEARPHRQRTEQAQQQLRPASSDGRDSSAVASPIAFAQNIGSGFENYFVYGDCVKESQPRNISRSVSHKTRVFGQSHWVNTIIVLKDVFNMVESDLTMQTSELTLMLGTCKHLARVIKANRRPPWPCTPTADLPSKIIADELLERYLQTIEPIYRILHVPTLRRDYDAVWVPDSKPDMAFIIQLKLIFAIGAATYDDTFSLRTSAIQWVYEAQTWLAEPIFKPRLQIQYLQTNILFLMARELADVGAELVWISAGELVRKAIYMGLNRDPTTLPHMTLYAAEMRRRLWNTILEIALQTSLTSGGPPLISPDDFDTQPPSNFEDEQLTAEGPVQKAATEFTQASVARALRSTFKPRLAIVKFLNDMKSARGTYAETLKLDAELRSACRAVRDSFAHFKGKTGPLPELRIVDFILHRYLSALHVPFFGPSLQDTTYAYSRKVVTDISLKLWRAAYPGTPHSDADSSNASVVSSVNTLQRLSICTTALYSSVLYQAAILIAVELRTSLLEEESIDPFPVRPDLLSVLDEAKEACLRAINAGETSVKGYLVAAVLEADVQALMQGEDRATAAKRLIRTAVGAVKQCQPILEEAAAQGQCTDTTEQMAEDWESFLPPPGSFTDNMDPMSWILNDTDRVFW